MTVTELAQSAGLSRSTVLYYESAGLLRRPRRTAGNYRLYAEPDAARLKQISVYRSAGLTLEDIRRILNRPEQEFAVILEGRLSRLGEEVERLRGQQWAIVRLLQHTTKLRKDTMLTKQKWVEIMRAAGFSEDDMRRWHVQFEKSAPEEHEQFLKFLNIPEAEVRSIRTWSREA